MKVTQVRSFPVQDDEGRGYFIVRVDTDAGIHGLGEAGIRNWGGAIAQAVDHLSELVVGADPWETERLWQTMFRGGFFPADKVYACAISAIDIAGCGISRARRQGCRCTGCSAARCATRWCATRTRRGPPVLHRGSDRSGRLVDKWAPGVPGGDQVDRPVQGGLALRALG